MSIRVLVVDDEPLARNSIRRFLKNNAEVEVIAECGDGESAVAAILTKRPDLVFLDVQMPEIDGFEVLRRIGVEQMPAIIFVTAFDRYALQAFDANAIDYLLKPFGKERFERALARAKTHIGGHRNHDEARRILAGLEQVGINLGYSERLPVAENGRITFVKTRDIDWIEADGNYVHLHVGNRGHDLRETLTNLEHKLNPRDFLRIHRSAIVNVRRIKEIRPWFGGYHLVVLENGKELRMSRYQRDVAKRLGLA